jgi:hypothetical protein
MSTPSQYQSVHDEPNNEKQDIELGSVGTENVEEERKPEIKVNKFDKFFNNDIDGGFLWLYNETSDGQKGFYSIFPYIAKEYIESFSSQNKEYNKEKNEKLRQFIECLKEDDNMFVYFFDLK